MRANDASQHPDRKVQERIERALAGDIGGFAAWLSHHRPLTGDWWGPDEWIVGKASVERALRTYLSGGARERDITSWASFVMQGGGSGPAPPGEHLLTIPLEYERDYRTLIGEIIARIEFADMDGFTQRDAADALVRLGDETFQSKSVH